MKKLLSLLLSVSIISSNISMTFGNEVEVNATDNMSIETSDIAEVDKTSEYYNPKFDAYIENIKDLPEEERVAKLANAPSMYSYNEEYVSKDADENSDIEPFSMPRASNPSSYNSAMPPSYISDFEDQGATGENCGWAFAANAAIEANMMSSELTADVSFSEEHLLRGTSNNISESFGYPRDYYDTGDFNMAVSYWTRGSMYGPVDDTFMLYKENVTSADVLDNKTKSGYMVTDTVTLSSLGANATSADIEKRISSIKGLIKDNGGVYVNVPYNSAGFNANYTAYYLKDGYNVTGNNPITLVGWNDTYSSTNFGTMKPNRNGAFVAVDSRTIGNKNIHYYFLSYDMTSDFGTCNSVAGIDSSLKYKHTYEHETRLRETYGGGSTSNSNGNTNAFVERFVSVNVDNEPEKIEAISTYCPVPNSYYKLYVGSSTSNMSEVAVEGNSYANGILVENAGYHTFYLKNPIEITSNEFFVGAEVYNATSNFTLPTTETYIHSTEGDGIYAESMNNIKRNVNTSVSRELVIKAHVGRESHPKMKWDFSSDDFNNLGDFTTKQNINGLTLTASTGKNMAVQYAGVVVDGIRHTHRLNLKGKGMGESRKLVFKVDGPVDIYFTGRASSLGFPRNMILSDGFKEIDTVSVDEMDCYKLSYKKNEPATLQMYSEQDGIHVYTVGYRPYLGEYQTTSADNKDWWFDSDELKQISEPIKETITTSDGLTIEATRLNSVSIVRTTNHTNGFTYYQAVSLNGDAIDGGRRILFDVKPNMDIYVTAAHRGDATETRKLYVVNDYGYEVIKDNAGNIVNSANISNQIKTYKFHYDGTGDTMALYSASEGIRIYRISTVYRDTSMNANDVKVNFEDVSLGNHTSIVPLINADILADASNNGYVTILNSSVLNGKFTKALNIILPHPSHVKNRSIKFSVNDSTQTPTQIRCICSPGSDLVLANDYSIIEQTQAPTTAEVAEIVFSYNGNAGDLYLYSPTTADIYELNVTNNASTESSINSIVSTDEIDEPIVENQSESEMRTDNEESSERVSDDALLTDDNVADTEESVCIEAAEIVKTEKDDNESDKEPEVEVPEDNINVSDNNDNIDNDNVNADIINNEENIQTNSDDISLQEATETTTNIES